MVANTPRACNCGGGMRRFAEMSARQIPIGALCRNQSRSRPHAMRPRDEGGRMTIASLRECVLGFTRLAADGALSETQQLHAGRALLGALIARDDWLPDVFAAPDPQRYRQYLLYCDPLERFSVVSFVWGPGQRTPIHDHTVWGLVGMLRGAEISRNYRPDRSGRLLPAGDERLTPGMVAAVSPQIGDIHLVENAL